MKTYWVGERPSYPWRFQVLNNETGEPENLAEFDSATVLLLDSDDSLVDIPAENVIITDQANGEVTFLWPQESVFTKPGRYVLQVKLVGPNTVRKTSVQDITVRALGGVNR